MDRGLVLVFHAVRPGVGGPSITSSAFDCNHSTIEYAVYIGFGNSWRYWGGGLMFGKRSNGTCMLDLLLVYEAAAIQMVENFLWRIRARSTKAMSRPSGHTWPRPSLQVSQRLVRIPSYSTGSEVRACVTWIPADVNRAPSGVTRDRVPAGQKGLASVHVRP
jgi:hypothetical protein